MSSPELAYYDAGQSVNYDRKLIADGHEWISYLSYAGNRRYIPIREVGNVSSSPTGTIRIVNNRPHFLELLGLLKVMDDLKNRPPLY